MRTIGIDLGLRDSFVAVCDGLQPRILENREAKSQTPSVVGVKRRRRSTEASADEGEIVVGDAALDNWALAPKDTIVSVKRLMGRSVSDPAVQKVRDTVMYSIIEPSDGTTDRVHVVMGGKEYSAIDISALILRRLKQDAEFRLQDEATHAVITVPAYFNQVQREATRKAGTQAGLKVLEIIDEPIAAAISFGMDRGDGTPKMLLVYDLGGGTFDVSVLMWAGNAFAPISIQGDMWLGDDSFDQPLVDHVVEYVRQEYDIDPTSHMRFMLELKRAAQNTKERLCSNRKADLVVMGALQDSRGDLIDIEIEITRELYERTIRGLVDHTVSLTKKALADIKTTPDQIDYVLMAGNSNGIPLVRQAMEELCGTGKVLKTVYPRHCVALGAAIMADRIGSKLVSSAPVQGSYERECSHISEDGARSRAACGTRLDDETSASRPGVEALKLVAPFHYGIASHGGRFSALVRKGDPFPTVKRGQIDVFTTEMQQRSLCIPLYGGDDVCLVDGNEKQGDAWIVLPPGLPLNSSVTFKLGLDADGIFEVGAELNDGACLPTRIYAGEARHEGTSCNTAYWRREGLIALAAFVLRNCEWTLSSDQGHYIQEATRGKDVLLSFENAVNASQYSARCLWVYVASRAIERLVQPHSRLVAAYLSGRVVEVECGFQADHPSAQTNLRSLINEIAECTSIFESGRSKVPHERESWNS